VSYKGSHVPRWLFSHVNEGLGLNNLREKRETFRYFFGIVIVRRVLLAIYAAMEASRFVTFEIHNHTIVLLHDNFLVGVVYSGYLGGNISESLTRLKDELLISV
jgi:hypothetical protein